MQEIEVSFKMQFYDGIEELDQRDKQLLEKAHEAMNSAYAPYSDFQVGAAVELENGEIVLGSNQENSAYPSGLCAERVALFACGAKSPFIPVKTIAVKTSHETDIPLSPCGSCRQVMAEFERRSKRNIRVIMTNNNGEVFIIPSIQALLPLAFKGEFLKK